MKRIILLLILVLLASCNKWFEVKQSNGQTYVSKVRSEIFEIDTVSWKVGIKNKKEISKGFKLKFKIPKIEKDHANILYKKVGIDAWIFRINKKTRRGPKPIGHILYNIRNFNNVSDSVTAFIYYHSAAAGSEFRRQKCPAFKHNKKITELNLIDTPNKEFDLFVVSKGQYKSATIDTPSFSPIIFSGDSSLTGQYFLEFAMMNTKKKRLYSRWVPIDNIIEVESETGIALKDCVGINSEKNIKNKKSPRAEDFRLR